MTLGINNVILCYEHHDMFDFVRGLLVKMVGKFFR